MSLLCAEKANEMLMSVAKEKGQPAKERCRYFEQYGCHLPSMEDEPSAIGYFQEAIGLSQIMLKRI